MINQSTNSVKQNAIPYVKLESKLKLSIPNTITLLRLLALPHLIWSFNHEATFAMYGLFLFSIGSDFADGYISRKIGASSKFGSNLDTTADFLFINGMFLTFIFKGFYSIWILILIIFMFTQFVLTNRHFKKTIYDSIGKYYGSLLFGGIGLTLLFQNQIMYDIVNIGIVLSTLFVIISRIIHFLKQKPNQNYPASQ